MNLQGRQDFTRFWWLVVAAAVVEGACFIFICQDALARSLFVHFFLLSSPTSVSHESYGESLLEIVKWFDRID